MKHDLNRLVLSCIGLLAFSASTQAESIIWTNTASGLWTNSSNWSSGTVPGTLDDVFITNGSATITLDGDVSINSLTVTGTYSGSITFRTGVTANISISNTFYLGTGAKLVPTYSSTNGNGTGRSISVLGDVLINGTIDASGQGFPSGGGVRTGYGPGAQSTASHGGLGSWQFGPTYGSLTQPTSLGSGSYDATGGGAIKLSCGGTLTLNGAINANSGSAAHGGAGVRWGQTNSLKVPQNLI